MGHNEKTILLIAHQNSLEPVLKLEKPTGTILMFWPSAWGLTMAAFATGLPLQLYGGYLLECFIGAFLLRSSACTVNDIFDREMDAGVVTSAVGILFGDC
ncbi:hypothetical protein C0995_016207 [Termitomyces sp. Mi166|nr:hypothetical protein C0995_016207 [Termitomyces sp. Mi166\